MAKKLDFSVKKQLVDLAGACFWYWNSFHSFLDSCGVPSRLWEKYPQGTFSKYDLMRNLIGDLEESGDIEVLNSIVSNFYRLKGAVDRDNLDEARAKRLLQELRDLVGNDPIEVAIQKREQEKAKIEYQTSIDRARSHSSQLGELNGRFMRLASGSTVTPQQRGFDLETIFFDLLAYSEMDHSQPYRTPAGEQIDGHFKYEKFDYLVEAKWTDGPTKQSEISVFDGKIRGKAQSTRGLFLSTNGFDDNAINKFTGDAPRIVLMTGEDLALILNGQFTMFDVMKAKVDAIVRFGNIHFAVRGISKR